MTTCPRGFALHPFDIDSPAHLGGLAILFADYLEAEFNRTGRIPRGRPVAAHMTTAMVMVNGRIFGFATVDALRWNVELIYLDPAIRGRGIGCAILGIIARAAPRPLKLAGPLTPGGQALADRTGLPVVEPEASLDVDDEQLHRDVAQVVRARCRHQVRRAPGRLCPPCTRAILRRIGPADIARQVGEIRRARGFTAA